MSEQNASNKEGQQQPAETQEQREQRLAEAYRAQREGSGGADEGLRQIVEGEKPQRPESIPEKFWDAEKGEVRVEDLAKSYVELEKQRTKQPDPKKADDGADEGEGSGEGADAKTAFADYRKSMNEKIASGAELTDADYAPAEKLGLSREDVDTFISGLKAMAELRTTKVHTEVGGKDAYGDMLAWARESFTEAEVAAYDRDVNSGDEGVALNAVRGLAARYRLANGKAGRDVTGKGRKGTGDVYESKAEMISDMQGDKYKKDPAERARVARKVQATRLAGIELR